MCTKRETVKLCYIYIRNITAQKEWSSADLNKFLKDTSNVQCVEHAPSCIFYIKTISGHEKLSKAAAFGNWFGVKDYFYSIPFFVLFWTILTCIYDFFKKILINNKMYMKLEVNDNYFPR